LINYINNNLKKRRDMKKLEKMGLVPLTRKEAIEENGGTTGIDVFRDFKVCCWNIPPMPEFNIAH